MKKKFASLFMAMIMILTLMPCAVNAVTGTQYGDVYYEVNSAGTGVKITGVASGVKNVTVPKEINGIVVNSISDDAFKDNTLDNIYTEQGSTFFASIDGVLYNSQLTKLIAYPLNKTDNTLIFPDTFEEINYTAFYKNNTAVRILSFPKSFVNCYTDAFSKFSHDDVFIPYPAEFEVLYDDTVPVLSALKNKYDLAVIANQFAGTDKRLKNFGIYDDFKFVLASSDVGVSKPNPVIFKTALEKAGCYAYEAFMIGDRIDNDIAPAKSLGINTVWIRQGYGGLQSPEKFGCIPDFIVNSLNELLDIL